MGINAIKLRPLHDRILVRRLEGIHQTASGILIPDAASEKPDQGEVVAAGAGVTLKNGSLRPLDVRVGDMVLFGNDAGRKVKVAGEEFLVMREDDIIAVLNN